MTTQHARTESAKKLHAHNALAALDPPVQPCLPGPPRQALKDMNHPCHKPTCEKNSALARGENARLQVRAKNSQLLLCTSDTQRVAPGHRVERQHVR